MPLNKAALKRLARESLLEDAAFGDITTRSFIQEDARVEACILAKEDGIVCGAPVAYEVFKVFDKKTSVKILKYDGQAVKKGDHIIRIKGLARSVLSCERVALNFLTYLSGIASSTHEAVIKVKPRAIRILDTRKTTPTLRLLEKYAVFTGGGKNHRLDLSGQYLVKENHLQVINLTSGPEVLSWRKKNVLFEIEVHGMAELRNALSYSPDILMLDNFSPADVKKAILFIKKIFPDKNKRPMLELSGGINSKNISRYAIKGVDFISLGALTHSARALDLSLDITKVFS
ncbi:MAG: carboxylating nicotinate-nucleotide diphosphorylase [Candidatus Omnitrophica bacterium]|nr:carboxylating nicotinate-nucleotide diphosphorylase [Candidatus Omnitrophota bacterium]